MMPYVPPKLNLTAFNCPRCGAFSKQRWSSAEPDEPLIGHAGNRINVGIYRFGFCEACEKVTLWFGDQMIYPLSNGAPLPHPDLPEKVKLLYEEARSIHSRSPRGAAALIRLAIEKLTDDILGKEKGRDLNDNVSILVKKGLPEKIQKALDLLRVIGNNFVHPGQIIIEDDDTTALNLFTYLNMIADYMIRQPKELDEAYNSLPKNIRNGISKRDVNRK